MTVDRCLIQGCNHPKYCNDLCRIHYGRNLPKNITLSNIDIRNTNVIQRIEENIIPEPNSGCWFYMGWINRGGYGRIKIGSKKLLVHRTMHQAYKGFVPEDRLVCHTCDIPCCCNPDHLYVGTHGSNSSDMVIRNRQVRGEQSGRAKLTNDDILYIRTSSETGINLAKRFDVSPYTISNIRCGKYWTHISHTKKQKQRRLTDEEADKIYTDVVLHNISISTVSKEMNISRQTIHKIKTGKRKVLSSLLA